MGVKHFGQILHQSSTSISHFHGKRAAVDAQSWMMEYSSGLARSKLANELSYEGHSTVHLIATLRGLRKLFRFSITPIFAFDGPDIGGLKLRNVKRGISSAQMPYNNPFHYETMRCLLEILDVPYIDSEMDGEAEAAGLTKSGRADIVLSTDYDSLLFGAPVMVRGFTGYNNEMQVSLAETLEQNKITREQLVEIALAVGTDYNQGIPTVGVKTALREIKNGKSLEQLGRENGYIIPDGIHILRSYFLDPVTDDGQLEEIWQPIPDLDALVGFLKALNVSDCLIEDEISQLTKSLNSGSFEFEATDCSVCD